MTRTGLVRFKDILRMLDECAPGAVVEAKEHHNWVRFGGRTYRGLPLGKHGARKNPEIEAGHVRRMARFFGILDCARKLLSTL